MILEPELFYLPAIDHRQFAGPTINTDRDRATADVLHSNRILTSWFYRGLASA